MIFRSFTVFSINLNFNVMHSKLVGRFRGLYGTRYQMVTDTSGHVCDTRLG